MKINLKFFFILFCLTSFYLAKKETTIKIVTTKEEEKESEYDTMNENIIPVYKCLYPPVSESYIFDDNNIALNNKILKLEEELPALRYKKAKLSN